MHGLFVENAYDMQDGADHAIIGDLRVHHHVAEAAIGPDLAVIFADERGALLVRVSSISTASLSPSGRHQRIFSS